MIEIKDIFPKHYKIPDRPSLVHLCEKIFKKKLCKRYTCTNWERRPLLENQLHYAALDTYVVLEMHKRLSENHDKK